jgi:HD-like signal output (HDOD) protein
MMRTLNAPETAQKRSTTGPLLANIPIQPRPQVLTAIEQELQRKHPSMRTIADLVAQDLALSAAVLKTVNSPAYGIARPLESIRQAVTLLGVETLVTLVTAIALRNQIPKPMPRFWDNSVRIASLSAAIASHLGCLSPSEAYLFGLFRDCGIPLLWQRFPKYPETLHCANREFARAFTAVEDERHATNHAVVGSLLAAHWHLPKNVVDAIALHHDRNAFQLDHAPEILNRISIAILAERIESLWSGRDEHYEWEKLGQAALDHLLLSDEAFAALSDELQDKWRARDAA